MRKRIRIKDISSAVDFHPVIKNSKLNIDDKIMLQFLLETEFNNDFKALLKDMMDHAVGEEQYELAVIIRDELNK
jgi:protein-arginine kinase activator protein McsA